MRAPIELGFDRARARELQWLFTNARIAPRTREHVLDSFFGFLEALGIHDRTLRWDIPLTPAVLEYAHTLIPDAQPTLVISPCSSHSRRNWHAERYAAVADHAVRRHGMRVILAGGRTPIERDIGAAIEQAAHVSLVNQIGRDTLPQLLALLARATVLLIARFRPRAHGDHGRHAGDRPLCGHQSRAQRAVSFAQVVRERLPAGGAALSRRVRRRSCPGAEKIEEPGVMDLIEVDAGHREARRIASDTRA